MIPTPQSLQLRRAKQIYHFTIFALNGPDIPQRNPHPPTRKEGRGGLALPFIALRPCLFSHFPILLFSAPLRFAFNHYCQFYVPTGVGILSPPCYPHYRICRFTGTHPPRSCRFAVLPFPTVSPPKAFNVLPRLPLLIKMGERYNRYGALI